jgi:cellulose synthase/poly-beta-1,6-N-acetylglucosamine synthase-like glycosyltransferase
MMTAPEAVRRYLDRNRVKGPWRLDGNEQTGYYGAIIIPSLAEGDRLFKTLQCLDANPPRDKDRFLTIVVVNHGQHASAATKQQNANDLERLAGFAKSSELSLAWIDAASLGREVTSKLAGVGLARKLGMDQALSQLDWTADPLLVCLDADTLVEKSYLQTITKQFHRTKAGAAVLPFRHQAGTDRAQQSAIERYELYLRGYVYGLRLANSPYAFHSVGSAMACRASAYVRCGGMNGRKAGEDFYFLQKLAKTAGVEQLSGPTVYPEPRVSDRVPFGTGRSMLRLLEGSSQAVLLYPVEVFKTLAGWLHTVSRDLDADAVKLLAAAEKISPVLAGYLEQLGWEKVWPRLQSTHPANLKRRQAFHIWFDGFRTMRLIHLLCDSGFSRGEPDVLLPEYFAWDDRPCPNSLPGMLEELRRLDRVQASISLSKI